MPLFSLDVLVLPGATEEASAPGERRTTALAVDMTSQQPSDATVVALFTMNLHRKSRCGISLANILYTVQSICGICVAIVSLKLAVTCCLLTIIGFACFVFFKNSASGATPIATQTFRTGLHKLLQYGVARSFDPVVVLPSKDMQTWFYLPVNQAQKEYIYFISNILYYKGVVFLGFFLFFGGCFFLFFWSPGPLIAWCPGHLVPVISSPYCLVPGAWSPGPLVPASFGPWSFGPLVLWSSGLLVPWSSVLFRCFFANLSFALFYYLFSFIYLLCLLFMFLLLV